MRKRGLVFLLALLVTGAALGKENPDSRLMLKTGWWVQSSAKVEEGGEALSKPGVKNSGWYAATMPATVLAVLTAARVYQDPYFGMNLRKVPGAYVKPFDSYANAKTPLSPFAKPWWYRTEFQLPDDYQGRTVKLNFEGINFCANIWLNGKKIADCKDVAGMFRYFEFDVTDLVLYGQPNALALEISSPTGKDLAMTWVDWNPAPPDRNMGIWRDVYLSSSGPVSIKFPGVVSDIDIPSLDKARLTVLAELKNATDKEITGTLKGSIGDLKFSQEIKLGPKAQKSIAFTPDKFPALNINNPRLWWPYGLGAQELYQLDLEFVADGKISDRQSAKFGIRKVTSEMTPEKYLLFKINGKNILIRGAGWTPDMMLRHDLDRLTAEIRYVKEMNLNAIRLEGKMEFDEFYEICDREGILVMPGWCCCDHWERWNRWDEADYKIAVASEKDQCQRLRTHPSVFVWLNGSDNPPPADVEKLYLDALSSCSWPNPVVSSATEQKAKLSGPSGVKMNGPYEWVPPVYWLADKKKFGGAWGFNTETSPGPAVPPIESLRAMLPEKKLWPINQVWNYHAGRGAFGNLRVYTNAQDIRYGTAKNVEDYAKKSQAMTYEGQRAMFEAFARNKYTSTGVIQWMLNTAWPGMIWHLYDYYLRPAGGYFGTQRACERLHIQYGYDDNSVSVVNSYYRDFPGLVASVKIINLDMTEKFSKQEKVDVPSDGSVKVLNIPEINDLSSTYFLKLELKASDGKIVSSNFYWLSSKPEVPNWLESSWYMTPVASFADFTALQYLPQAELKLSRVFEKAGNEQIAKVTIENIGKGLAFMVRLKINKAKGEEVLPVFWEDNYFSLLPGEKREVIGKVLLKDLGDEAPVLEVTGWNVATKSY